MSSGMIVSFVRIVPAALLVFATIGCGGSPTPMSGSGGEEPAAAAAQGEEDKSAEMAAKEDDLARREAELQMKEKEQELNKREAALTAKEKAARSSTPPKTVEPPASTPPPPPPPEQMAEPLVVPTGTQLSVELLEPITTKTAQVGDRVDARLASDLFAGDRLVARAGASIQGTVTEVVSGSHKIGGTPTLGLTFDSLELAGGSMAAISGRLVQQGKSDTAKDSAKIAGATVAGAILGHQIDSKKGKIIGGLLGGAAGTAAAAKTGGEVEVPAGTVLGFQLDAPLEVQ